ncbi:MAG: right-handed parallel beta-helix repeat-containing protein, partial [Sedimentisphaerales bacterium]|nr:right-handed parallel beta-helix repeat-containing protein [Sedimentisphaerales bacterium]
MKKSVYLLVTLIFTIPCYPATVYVNWDGSADYTTIQAAINAADPNDTVIVAPGTYVENVNMLLKNGIALQGSGSDVTTIDGGSNGHVVTFNASSGSISGFTITNSGSDPGYSAGVFTSNCTVDVVDNIITGNNYGITFSSGADGLIFGNRVTNNTNHAINIKSSFAVITNNLIANNSRHGVYCYKSSPFMSNNTIINNNYGILCSPTSEQIIMNNIIVSNNYGIMALGDDSSPVPLLNISYNDVNANSTADYWYEWVIYCIPEDPFCIPQGESESFTPLPGTGEIHVNPIFVDQSNGDYHLKSQAGRWDPVSEDWVLDVSTSPCIDAGNPGCP